MKAAIFRGPHQDMTIEDIEIDEPWAHEVVVKTAASGVCHSDLLFVDGHATWPTPAVLGHEGAGVVESVGSEVTYVQPGDHVIVTGIAFCGQCDECLGGYPSRCLQRPLRRRSQAPRLSLDGTRVLALTQVGSFAEKMLVPDTGVVKIPEDFPFEAACLMGCGVITGLGAVFRAAKVEPGTTVAVFGAGGVGLSAIQGARIAGARQIIAVDLNEEKLQRAHEFGATDTVNASEEADPVAAIKGLTGRGAHYAFEAIGNPVTASQTLKSIRAGGTATIIGAVTQPWTMEPGMLGEDRKLIHAFMGQTRNRIDMPAYIEMYQKGILKLDELITRRGRLEDVNQAFDDQREHVGARTVLNFD